MSSIKKKPHKDPNKNLSYYEVNKTYSITLNPIDKYQYLGNPDRYNKFRTMVYHEISKLRQSINLWIEISEPHQMILQGKSGPRLHMHGTIKFISEFNIVDFLVNGIYKLTRWTSVDIDTIEDSDIWHAYCTKQSILPKPKIF